MNAIELTPQFSKLFMALSLGLVGLSLTSAALLLRTSWQGHSLFPGRTPTRLAPWGLPAVLMFVASLVIVAPACMFVAEMTLPGTGTESEGIERLKDLLGFSLGSLISLGLTIGLLRRSGSDWIDLGLSLRDLPIDLRLGLFAFGLICLPMYGLQALLAKLWKESEHPIIEIVGENPSPWFFGVLTISAVVIAPFVEELFFRVLLQGWFEKLAMLLKMPVESRRAALDQYWWGEPLHRRARDSAEDSITVERVPVPLVETPLERLPWWPVLASAGLFALAHAGYGPDPIPLFLLACVLGLLYRNTRRAWPCIFLHMLVNATSMCMLWIVVRGAQAG